MLRQISATLVPILCAFSATAALEDPTYRLVAVDASSLPKVIAVLDSRAAAAGAAPLSSADFKLLEDGKATALATRTVKFRDTGMGLALIVAIDASRSMEGRPLNAIRQGLTKLVSRKRNNDRVSVLTFADDVRWETRWDASGAAMQETFRNLRTRGNRTRLYDAIGKALDEFAAESGQDTGFPSRMSILVLSDGVDEGSEISLQGIAGRLRSSRIRLDAAGLARSPSGLQNLKTLASAGFGGFVATSTPEGLTRLLGQGIDSLLDMPAVEFSAERKSGDGKAHQLGVEYLPSHWRDQMAVKLPEGSLLADRKLWIAGGVAVLLLLGALYFATERKRASVVAGSSAVAAPPPPPAPAAYRRTETVMEPAPELPHTAQLPTVVEPRPQPVMATAARTSPARVATILAPQKSTAEPAETLVALAGPYAGQRFVLSVPEFWIGSSSNNHLCLSADSAVSGNHACIRREDRFLRIYDNGSLNNTLVNGRAIGREAILLQTGDRIRIGQSELSLEL